MALTGQPYFKVLPDNSDLNSKNLCRILPVRETLGHGSTGKRKNRMITLNKLDKSFGTAGSTAGMIVFTAGVILSCFYFSAFILILIGAFAGFSNSCVLIDYDRKRLKFSNNLFGILRIGKWMAVDPAMKIGIRESNQTYRSYSQGNRPLDVTRHDFRLVLYDGTNKGIMHIKKTLTVEAARTELEIACRLLGLTAM